MAKTDKQLRASQFNWGKYLLAGIDNTAFLLHRGLKVIDRGAYRMIKEAVRDARDSINVRAESEGINVRRK